MHGVEPLREFVTRQKIVFLIKSSETGRLDPTPGLGESHTLARLRAPATLTEDIDP